MLLVVYIVYQIFVTDNIATTSYIRLPWKTARILGNEPFNWNIYPYLALLPAATSYAVAIPLLMQGLLHLPSLPVFMMLFVCFALVKFCYD